MVSKAKYEAWYKFHQMPKHQAMIRYLEVVSILKDEHFRSANLDGGIVASSSYFSPTVLHFVCDETFFHCLSHIAIFNNLFPEIHQYPNTN